MGTKGEMAQDIGARHGCEHAKGERVQDIYGCKITVQMVKGCEP